jgi:YHS domain-containing protein
MNTNNNMQREEKTIKGTIKKIDKNQKAGPKGFIYIEESPNKFIAWNERYLEDFSEGDTVNITYYISENKYNGKTYENCNIVSMRDFNDEPIGFTEEDKEILDEVGQDTTKLPSPKVINKSVNGKIKLNGLMYKIKEIELELITNDE